MVVGSLGGLSMKLTMVALIAFLVPAAANANTIMGEGFASCGQWTKASAEPQGAVAFAMGAWVRGYLTAQALAATSENHYPDILRDTDADAVMAWVDNYCAKNPLDKIVDATGHLVLELIKRAAPARSN
jgi:hypothetical protein